MVENEEQALKGEDNDDETDENAPTPRRLTRSPHQIGDKGVSVSFGNCSVEIVGFELEPSYGYLLDMLTRLGVFDKKGAERKEIH